MKAVQIYQYGEAGELKYEDAPLPEIQPDEVLVKVYASGVNPVDWKVRKGYLKDMIPYSFPLIVGWDMAGVIEKTGDGVTDLKAGDEVYGMTDMMRNGTYAEYVAVKAAKIGLKPQSLDFVTAASVPMAGHTAWQGIFEHGKLQAGQKILINGAAGSVGSMAVQLARWKGAFITGTASKQNAAYLTALGADMVLDYHEENFEDRIKNVDVLFDTVGGETQIKLLRVMKPGGIVVSTVGITDPEAVKSNGLQGIAYSAVPVPAQLKQIADLIDAGKLQTLVSKVLPLQDVAEAHRLSEEGHMHGKIVLKVAD